MSYVTLLSCTNPAWDETTNLQGMFFSARLFGPFPVHLSPVCVCVTPVNIAWFIDGPHEQEGKIDEKKSLYGLICQPL